MGLENIIFGNLLSNEDYSRKVIPFLKVEYFTDNKDKITFQLIQNHFLNYNKPPTIDVLQVDLSNKIGISEQTYKDVLDGLNQLFAQDKVNTEWLVDQTERFCQEKAVYNAIMSSIQILDDKNGQAQKGAIPQILSDALAVSFDTHIGHDFIEDSSNRFDFYHEKQVRIPFGLDYFNKITQGGLPKKTLNVALAGTGVGKSLFMCHCAATNMAMGYNVLYITLEMSEEEIAKRIDANMLNVQLDELKLLPKETFQRRMGKIKEKQVGKLIIKEYPTASAGSANFRHLLNELKIKKEFAPDIIYIDYLNICSSSRLKHGANVNSYSYIKAIAEEIRGLAVEFNVPIVSATQTTRSGYSSSDLGLEDTSESFGLPATADFMFGLSTSEELEGLNQIMVKQLKNRYSDPGTNRRFVLGIDRSKMRLYDVEVLAQDDLIDRPVMDSTSFGEEDENRSKTFDKSKLKGFK